MAYWEGMDIRLGYAPQLIDGQMFVHYLDVAKTIAPLLNAAPLCCLRSNSIIVIDPGHGGENAGTKSVLGSHYEKEFTLDWGRRLQSLLVAKGWQVYLTRNVDSDLALSNRVAFAQAHQAGLFISLHFNSAAPDEGEAGLETYILTPAGMPSTVTRGFSDNSGQSFPNNEFDAQNLEFAARIHREILAVNGHRDRGVRRARFLGVLRNQQRPAILIEGGYLSNPAEARLIATPAFRQKLAEAVAKSLETDSLAANQN
jgi:N-acetylmuramoyl-L-alanine amidase